MSQQKRYAGALLTIDLNAIRNNYRFLRKRAGRAVCGAVVKADAYGLGAAQVAPVLAAEGCRHFFVAHLDEGIALRPHLPEHAELFVLHGPPLGSEDEFFQYHLIPVLNSTQQIQAWRGLALRQQRVMPAIIQIDSGMSRLGLSAAEVTAWVDNPDFIQGIDVRYLMSHLACAERRGNPMNAQQLQHFNAVRQQLQLRLPQCAASLANSSGIFLGPDFQFDLVRPGAALYGIAPTIGEENPMQPVVLLQGKIIQTRMLSEGSRVGYGATFCAYKPHCIATVSVGYADGWLRSFSNRGVAYIDDLEVPLVGIVSMDTITLDVTRIDPERVVVGATVDLISARHPVDKVAALAGTIGYEILTNLGHRYERRYIDK